MRNVYLLFVLLLLTGAAYAGNPERAGQAGAGQLLINPFARSSGMGTINIANTYGIEAVMNNPAGLARARSTELVLSHTRWLVGADININSLGFSQRISDYDVLGVYVSAFDVGDIQRTTIDQPDGGLGTFSPTMMNLGVTYAHGFLEGRINVGFTAKFLLESVPDAGVSGLALDAGIQYASEDRRFKLGTVLRNIGPELRFSGEGLGTRASLGGDESTFDNVLYTNSEDYQLPSVFLIGMSYDFHIGPVERRKIDDLEVPMHRLTPMLSFHSNTFSEDQYGLGMEYSFRDYFMVRAAYQFEANQFDRNTTQNVFTGFSGGMTVEMPFNKKGTTIGIDYSFRTTYFFDGVHSFGLRLNLAAPESARDS